MAEISTDPKQSTRMQPPPGLKSLIEHCQSVYPDQPNPLQVTTVLKYWLGGQDPLDYISMYDNKGDPENGVPPHWHYISFGLSDLHGDGRVHARETNDERSGMGFEITFRLLKSEAENKSDKKSTHPPTWPANLLQAIARYCFQTGNMLYFGDNIPWRKSLDGSANSRLQNILITQDEQLGSIETVFGRVEFCQVVGVTDEELEQASRWNGRGVLNYLRQDIQTGGKWWITNMNRSLSVFELFPELLLNLQDDLEKQGSDLAGVNAEFTFREIRENQCIKTEIDSNSLNEQCVSDENNRLENLQIKCEDVSFPQSMSMSSSSLHKSCPLSYQPDSVNSISLEGIEITLAPYAAKYLILAVKDRIRHGRHFTFKAQHLALTLVAESVTGSIVNKSSPYGVIGYWIQVLVPNELIPRMMDDFQGLELEDNVEIKKRIEFNWPEFKLKLIIDNPGIMMDPPPAGL
ncbi:suppressor of fused homolog isoform X2 [Ceratitis capitata]|uniref:Suppressor of fused homolog n=2 Tax=Ceratitis capitata TaxID=7213 RepID=W8C1N7_CERCA|nr:suppressor of fused homolog isoform X2 [Ceratitis capitata]XP_020715379.1 suppressor of fused homolog isoform X2 [Ceratitis capitata]